MPSVTPGDRTTARSACARSCLAPTNDEIPQQREPRRHERDPPTRASVLEQPFAIFADGTPIGRHARAAFRNARLERA